MLAPMLSLYQGRSDTYQRVPEMSASVGRSLLSASGVGAEYLLRMMVDPRRRPRLALRESDYY